MGARAQAEGGGLEAGYVEALAGARGLHGKLSSRELGDELIAAAGKGDAAEVRRLLAAGADVEARQRSWNAKYDGNTALIEAVRLGRVETARILLAAGADIHARGQRGYNAVEEALQLGMGYDAILLVLGRVDDVPEYLGAHAMELALTCHNEVRLAELVYKYRPADVGGDPVTTPLHWVMHCARPDFVRFLLERGADIHRKDIQGRTALAELLNYLKFHGKALWLPGWSDVGKLLIEAGVTPEEARELLPAARELLSAQEEFDARYDGIQSENARFYRRVVEELESRR